ncbi:MAG TPA: RNA polymerase sigma factor [Bellilinea sp.]|nr:RNA polymerase sigma factor [Bellilinea sp.]
MAESSIPLTHHPLRIEPDEAQLITAARHDLRNFDALYKHHVTAVFRYLYSRTGNVLDSEDITAQTFLIALETFNRFRGDGHFRAWLFGIARNKVVDLYRTRKTELPLDDAINTPTGEDPLLSAIRLEQKAVVAAIIAALTDEEQELLRLRYLGEMSYREIANLLQSNEDAVKKTTYRLLARIQSQLEDPNE